MGSRVGLYSDTCVVGCCCCRVGVVMAAAGQMFSGRLDGRGTVASFSALAGITIALDGTIAVADESNGLIRKISSAGRFAG